MQEPATVAAGAVLNDSLINSGNDIINGAQNVSGGITNTATGMINVNSGGVLNVDATLGFLTNTNNGTITVAGAINFADSGRGNGTEFAGGGTIQLSGGSINATSDMYLVNAGNAITGNGTIGGASRFVNDSNDHHAVGDHCHQLQLH